MGGEPSADPELAMYPNAPLEWLIIPQNEPENLTEEKRRLGFLPKPVPTWMNRRTDSFFSQKATKDYVVGLKKLDTESKYLELWRN